MVDDGLGHLWMSSNDGIFRVRLDELEAAADAIEAGRKARIVSIHYDERDGMHDREANGDGRLSGLRDREGRILFPTMGGVVRLDPRTLTQEIRPPRVDLERITWSDSLQGDSLQSDSLQDDSFQLLVGLDEIRLTPEKRTFTLTFRAPNLRAGDRLHFRYRLHPYDDAWIDAGTRREALTLRSRWDTIALRSRSAAKGSGVHRRFSRSNLCRVFLKLAGFSALKSSRFSHWSLPSSVAGRGTRRGCDGRLKKKSANAPP